MSSTANTFGSLSPMIKNQYPNGNIRPTNTERKKRFAKIRKILGEK